MGSTLDYLGRRTCPKSGLLIASNNSLSADDTSASSDSTGAIIGAGILSDPGSRGLRIGRGLKGIKYETTIFQIRLGHPDILLAGWNCEFGSKGTKRRPVWHIGAHSPRRNASLGGAGRRRRNFRNSSSLTREGKLSIRRSGCKREV